VLSNRVDFSVTPVQRFCRNSLAVSLLAHRQFLPNTTLMCVAVPSGRDIAELAKTAEIKLGHEKEVALALHIARFSGEAYSSFYSC
jgi:hypothetical protein